ncbi:hypothetical protein Cgig2_025939 [Carnegiea gigantea]|uniref:Ubiquitin-like protease family profile domain-containing protein n=1 Tax=Carnegiea gigantea TaxID=171969 RepID=A0A9Q1JZL7_9CARY|nr:hypothetical protein Cgig2_025939 [Carnegiea gigantea]
MKRRPQCRKPAVVHRTPYADPARHHGGHKKQKDLTDEGMGAEKVPGGDEPSEGEVLAAYITVSLSATENELINTVRGRYKGLQSNSKILRQGGGREGVLAETGACELVAGPYQHGPKCWSRGQVQDVTLHNKARIATMIWDTFKRSPHADVFMPLLETTEGHWLLQMVDLQDRCFIVYDSLPNAADKNRQALIDSAVIC